MVTVLVGLAIVVGIAGTLLPLVPGVGLIWAAALAFGVLEGFGFVGWTAMVIISALGVAAIVAGVRVPQRAAAAGGIGWRGQLMAFALAVVGFFVIPVAGAPIGFVVGIYLVARRRYGTEAWPITKRTVRSLVFAAGLQFVAAIAMALTWLVWAIVV
ncbi:MAG: DUF456 domain-containing protein [Acidimicrobiia bacterium]